MIRRFGQSVRDFLGPGRMQALFFLLAGTGLASLVLNAVQAEWVRPAQSLLVLVFAAGAAVIAISAMPPEERGRWVAILLPAVGAILLGLTVVPQYLMALLGAALGWVVAGTLIFRSRTRREYHAAVKHLRRNQYDEAVKIMDQVIKMEPQDLHHYRFRAEILRIWGKLDRARRDYARMTELDPDSAVGYNGLAEVELQAGHFERALVAAERAYALAPGEWVAAYNLGMIEDRLGRAEGAVQHLERALTLHVPEARHRLLIRLYLARAYARLADVSAARGEVESMRKERQGLKEWQTLLESDQAATLRAVLGDDVEAARALIDGRMDAAALANGNSA